MNIKIRKAHNLLEVIIEDRNTTIDLGLCNVKEVKELLLELEDAVATLEYFIQKQEGVA